MHRLNLLQFANRSRIVNLHDVNIIRADARHFVGLQRRRLRAIRTERRMVAPPSVISPRSQRCPDDANRPAALNAVSIQRIGGA